MEFPSPQAAQFLLWTFTRIAALAVLATEALFLWTRRAEPTDAPAAHPGARFFWAATPAVLLAGLTLWCLTSVASGDGASAATAVAQLSR